MASNNSINILTSRHSFIVVSDKVKVIFIRPLTPITYSLRIIVAQLKLSCPPVYQTMARLPYPASKTKATNFKTQTCKINLTKIHPKPTQVKFYPKLGSTAACYKYSIIHVMGHLKGKIKKKISVGILWKDGKDWLMMLILNNVVC